MAMNDLETVRFVKEKLLLQGQKSMHKNMCMFRADSTPACKVRCAIGHLIPDELYNPGMETISINNGRWWQVLQAVATVSAASSKLLSHLQYIHDNLYIMDWKKKFENLEQELSG